MNRSGGSDEATTIPKMDRAGGNLTRWRGISLDSARCPIEPCIKMHNLPDHDA
ncbi:hypothetical protein SLG_10230 [Sphingobium sp. SYK-6]|nr:hypothetical protein SLG_10230 [Sphingobium sp. SYK-6]